MPYIEKEARKRLDYPECMPPKTPAELNYVLTKAVLRYLVVNQSPNGPSYQHYNDAIGALEACKLELYRRMVAPYERIKVALNGDVYPEPI